MTGVGIPAVALLLMQLALLWEAMKRWDGTPLFCILHNRIAMAAHCDG